MLMLSREKIHFQLTIRKEVYMRTILINKHFHIQNLSKLQYSHITEFINTSGFIMLRKQSARYHILADKRLYLCIIDSQSSGEAHYYWLLSGVHKSYRYFHYVLVNEQNRKFDMERLIVISRSETMWKLKKRMKLRNQKGLLLAKTWTRIWISIQFVKLHEKLSKLSLILRVK
jgi:hypothetical protein